MTVISLLTLTVVRNPTPSVDVDVMNTMGERACRILGMSLTRRYEDELKGQ